MEVWQPLLLMVARQSATSAASGWAGVVGMAAGEAARHPVRAALDADATAARGAQ